MSFITMGMGDDGLADSVVINIENDSVLEVTMDKQTIQTKTEVSPIEVDIQEFTIGISVDTDNIQTQGVS